MTVTNEVLDRHMKTFGSQDMAGVMADYARLTVRQLISHLSGFPPETVVSASFDAGYARGVVSAVEAGKGDGGLDDKCDSVVLVVD